MTSQQENGHQPGHDPAALVPEQAGAAAAGGPAAEEKWAVCCSGGGIRSASYCLGAIQGLQQDNGLLRRAKWILGVSGGSYIAGHRARLRFRYSRGAQPSP